MTQPPEPTEQDREAAHALVPWVHDCNGRNGHHGPTCDRITLAIATTRIRAHAEGRREGLAEAGALMNAAPGFVGGGYQLLRKDVQNGHFGWWVRATHDGRAGTAGEGFVSLPNLVAIADRAAKEPG